MPMDLNRIISEISNYPGVTRKRVIGHAINYFKGLKSKNILESFGEDAAVIAHGKDVLLLAADGIMEDLMEKNPYWAGYCSVLVNINDIAAMGGRCLGMVNVLSIKNRAILDEVLKGMTEALKKFDVPMLGGHVHPDCNYNAVDVAVLGAAKKDSVIFSNTANIGDEVIFAMDIDGDFTPGLPYSWDTTSSKTPETVQEQIAVMSQIGEKKLVTAAKDISNPGVLGTLGMLLESSKKGAEVDLEKVPKPENVDFLQWLKAYQGCGFVVTCEESDSKEVIRTFKDVGIIAEVVGIITSDLKLNISYDEEDETLFDFRKNPIIGAFN